MLPARRRVAWILAAAIAAAGLLLAAGSLRWWPARLAEAPRLERAARGAGPLLAGAAEVPIPVEPGTPIAGFPRLAWASEGVRDSVAVRALVLSSSGCAVALVSAEILLVPGPLAREVESQVRDLKLDAVVIGATHTHSGPGGWFDDPIAERIATGPYDRAAFVRLATRIAGAIRQAAAARSEATLSVARDAAPDLARNRDGGRVDGRLLALRLSRPGGEVVARVVVFPAHATLRGARNRLVSGDWPGDLMRALGPETLFFQGAVGDQSPAARPAGGARSYGRAVASRVAALRFPPGDPEPRLAAAVASAALPAPELGAAPPLLRRLVSNLVYRLAPERGRITAIRLGPALLLAIPAEPVAEVGRLWREEAGPGAEILALANDYLGYVETPERMSERLGEVQRTYYGPRLAERLGAAVRAAAEAADGAALRP